MNGSNLVKLSAREHFICHLLLTKMIQNQPINYAYIAMVYLENCNQQRDYKITSRNYNYAKELNSEAASIRFKGKQKHNVGKKKYHNPLTSEEIFRFDNDIIPDGYIKGRSPDNKKKMIGKLVGRIYYYNPTTNRVISITPNDIIPDGYIKGNPNANVNQGKSGRKQYFNIVTNKCVRKFPHERTINDIEFQTQKIYNVKTLKETTININDLIPEGWELGRSPSSNVFKKK